MGRPLDHDLDHLEEERLPSASVAAMMAAVEREERRAQQAEAEAEAARAEASLSAEQMQHELREAKQQADVAALEKSYVSAVVEAVKENAAALSNTPVARRTRAAAHFISRGLAAVVAVVSPKLVSAPSAPSAPSIPSHGNGVQVAVRRSSRLRPVA